MVRIDISAEPATPPEEGVKVHVRKGADMERILMMPKEYEGREVECCEDCPFFVDGAYYEYGVSCNVGGAPHETKFAPNAGAFAVGKTTIPENCPLPKAKDKESD